MKTGISGAVSTLTFALVLSLPAPGGAQEKVGVVTTVVGPVTVARASLPPEPLKFKDDVFVRDRVTTGEQAITRILLGGKVIITAREHSTLTITETPGLSTIHLTGGRIAVAVEKSKMKPGERVDIRTPNAVAGVRGTVLIVEAETNVSTVTVLRGLVHVTRLHPATGALVGTFTAVGARQTVSVRNNVLPARSKTITAARAQELSQEFRPPLKAMTSAAVLHDTDEIKRVLGKSDASASPAVAHQPAVGTVNSAVGGTVPTAPSASSAPSGPGVAAVPVPAAVPVVATPVATPPVATPVMAPPPVLSAVPTSIPVPPVVTAPVPAPVPTSVKTSSPNWGSSWKHASSKNDREDRSGSNSGKR